MKKWQYKVFTAQILGEGAGLLDELGNDGWEMIGTQIDHKGHIMFFFKREMQASQPCIERQ